MPVATTDTVSTLTEEDVLRARLYDLLGVLLRAPVNLATLHKIGALEGDNTPLGRGIASLAKLAAATTEQAAEREFNALFIGLGRGELVPYASYYMTGFLNEKPLARLRGDMTRLGIERAPDVFEPEDNIGSLCEMMAGLIEGRFHRPASLQEQRMFFNSHIAPWAAHFFTDLEGAQNSVLYAPIGAVGAEFIRIEKDAFKMGA